MDGASGADGRPGDSDSYPRQHLERDHLRIPAQLELADSLLLELAIHSKEPPALTDGGPSLLWGDLEQSGLCTEDVAQAIKPFDGGPPGVMTQIIEERGALLRVTAVACVPAPVSGHPGVRYRHETAPLPPLSQGKGHNQDVATFRNSERVQGKLAFYHRPVSITGLPTYLHPLSIEHMFS